MELNTILSAASLEALDDDVPMLGAMPTRTSFTSLLTDINMMDRAQAQWNAQHGRQAIHQCVSI
jgi:hypothetical protein